MAIIALVVNELRIRGQSGVSVPAQQAVRLINQGAAVVDVRDAASFGSGHILDAVNLPAAELQAQAETRFKKKRGVLVVCDSGSQSARCIGPLRKAGFENAWSLDGGLAAWRRENLPLAGAKPKA